MAYEVWSKTEEQDGRERLRGKRLTSNSYDDAAWYAHIESCRVQMPLYLLNTKSGEIVMFDVYGREHHIGYLGSGHRVLRSW